MPKPKKPVLCAGGCKTPMPKVEGYPCGWRPLCEACFQAGKSGDFNEFRTGEVRAVRHKIG